MANLMHRFFRNKSCFNPILRLTPPLFTYQKPSISNNESVSDKSDSASVANPVITVSGNESDQFMRFYPSFSMGYFMKPNMIQYPDLGETASLMEEGGKEMVIYADSVKKKRKKKMNKHKYRKLKKSLRRKT